MVLTMDSKKNAVKMYWTMNMEDDSVCFLSINYFASINKK